LALIITRAKPKIIHSLNRRYGSHHASIVGPESLGSISQNVWVSGDVIQSDYGCHGGCRSGDQAMYYLGLALVIIQCHDATVGLQKMKIRRCQASDFYKRLTGLDLMVMLWAAANNSGSLPPIFIIGLPIMFFLHTFQYNERRIHG